MRADHSGTHILEERTAHSHRTNRKESVLLEEIGKENFPNNFFQPCARFKGKSFRFARCVHLLILIRLKRCIIEKGDAVSIFYSQIKQVLYGGEDT